MSRIIILIAILSLFTNDVFSKCLPGLYSLDILHANGTVTELNPWLTYPDSVYWGDQLEYFDVLLDAGDTLIVTRYSGTCGALGNLEFQGNYLTWTNNVIKLTAPGHYFGGNCDDDCIAISFDIKPFATASGPIPVYVHAMLGGLINSGTSLSWYNSSNNLGDMDLIPLTEPYTAMGYPHVGGGGEQLITWTYQSWLIDWVILELRDPIDPSIIVQSVSCILTESGGLIIGSNVDALVLPMFNVPPGEYHLAIRHRNHLGVMTATPYFFGRGGAGPDIRFSDISFPKHGIDPCLELPNEGNGVSLLWPGNVAWSSGSQVLKYTGTQNDRDPILQKVGGNNPTATWSGYAAEDVNLDGIVKYIGSDNDRDILLQSIGGSVPTAVRTEQLP